jgi:hypothetical protein
MRHWVTQTSPQPIQPVLWLYWRAEEGHLSFAGSVLLRRGGTRHFSPGKNLTVLTFPGHIQDSRWTQPGTALCQGPRGHKPTLPGQP